MIFTSSIDCCAFLNTPTHDQFIEIKLVSGNNKIVDIKFSGAPHVSGITFIRYAKYRKIGKPNNFKVLRSNKTKSPKKQDILQNQLKLPMPEGGEPLF